MRIYYNQNSLMIGQEKEDGIWYENKIVLVRSNDERYVVEGFAHTYKRETKTGWFISEVEDIPPEDQPLLEAHLRDCGFDKPIQFK